MIELMEIEGEDYGKDLVEVVRCKDCIHSEGLEASKYRFCQLLKRWAHLDGYCDEAKKNDEV